MKTSKTFDLTFRVSEEPKRQTLGEIPPKSVMLAMVVNWNISIPISES